MENDSNFNELIEKLYNNEMQIDGDLLFLSFQKAKTNLIIRQYSLFVLLLQEMKSNILNIIKDDLEIEQINNLFKEIIEDCSNKANEINSVWNKELKNSKDNIENIIKIDAEIKNALEKKYNIKINEIK